MSNNQISPNQKFSGLQDGKQSSVQRLVRWEWFATGEYRKAAMGGWHGWLKGRRFATVWANGMWEVHGDKCAEETGIHNHPHTAMYMATRCAEKLNIITSNDQGHSTAQT